MKQFSVLAVRDGRSQQIRVTARDMDHARTLCDKRDHVIRIRELHARRSRRSKFSLGLFVQELVALLEAGLVLVEAIEALAEKSASDDHRLVLQGLLSCLYRGQSLSQAMQQQQLFPALLIASVASSEHSGQLPMALRRFHQYETQIENLMKKVRSALTYPLIVLSVGGGILAFLLFFVIPRFAAVFSGMGNLDGTARLIVWWAELLSEHGVQLAVAGTALVMAAVALLRSAAVRAALWKLFWSARRLNEQRTLFVLARFYRTLGLLIQGGMPVVAALELTGGLLPADRRADVAQALQQLREGQNVTTALVDANLTTPVAARLLRVGEKSGNLAGMCERIAQFHDEGLTRAIEMFSKIFEPVLMLVVGGLIGLIVFLLYMPIFELAGNVSS